MPVRRDVSKVKPLGSYAAKRCPVRIQLDILEPADPLPTSPELERIFEEGNRFEEHIVDELRRLARGDWVFVDEAGPTPREDTLAALGAGAPVIVGATLPTDREGKRSGKPDLLVRDGVGYVPVDIKHHRTLEESQRYPVRVSDLGDPSPASASEIPGQGLRREKGDALQLAHYQRMLEAAGFASGSSLGGIIGKEGQVVWYHLDELLWKTPAKSDGKRTKHRTSLECYDFEFDFRLDMAAVAHERLGDPDRDLELEPVKCGECLQCPWHDYCAASLSRGSGDPSLLPGIGYRPWRALRDLGVRDRAAVAALDLPTAELGRAGLDCAKVLETCSGVDPATPLAELFRRSKKAVRLLGEAGLVTAAQAQATLDARTARLNGAGWLPGAILNARAALGDAPVYRRPGEEAPRVPRADLELDVDMESVADGVYLWGVNVFDRGATGLAATGYVPFLTWNPLDLGEERRLFAEFWSWLDDLRGRARAGGHSVHLYAWHASAEETQIRRAVADTALEAEVMELLASSDWIDLEVVFKRHWLTGGSTSLKAIAPLAGHGWSVEDPGGARSMTLYAEAIGADAAAREPARQWLLDYNRGDVEATLAIRRWLDEQGSTWPAVPGSPGA